MGTLCAFCAHVHMPLTFEEEIDGLKRAVGAKTDMELAERLGVQRFAVSKWRQRATLPAKYKVLLLRPTDVDYRHAMEFALRIHIFGKVEPSYWLRAALAVMPAVAFDATDESPAARGRRLEGIILRVMNFAINATNTTLRQDYIRDDAECQRVIDHLLENRAAGIDSVVKGLPYTGPDEP